MSVSAVSSSPVDVSSLASSGTSGSSRSGGGIAADLSSFTQAESSGNTSGADAALLQLKNDLASEQTTMLSELMGSSGDASDSSDPAGVDAGNSLLSDVLSFSSNANISPALGDVQNLAAQNASATANASSAAVSGTAGGSPQASVSAYA